MYDYFADTDDWQVCLISCIGGGLIIAAGLYFMDFYSAKAGTGGSVRFLFSGVGFGIGGNLSGWALPGLVPNIWSNVPAKRPFCVVDLDGASGAIGSVSAGAGATIGQTNMSANVRDDILFDFDGDVGLSGGFSSSISGLRGTYSLKGEVANAPGFLSNTNWA